MDWLIGMLVVFGCLVTVMVLLYVLNTVWQRRHRRTKPPRHQGERQSQRGRVFRYGTNHSKYQEW